jgi:hypothetical protein
MSTFMKPARVSVLGAVAALSLASCSGTETGSEGHGDDHNNGPVQALNARTLYLDEKPTVAIR